MPSIHPAQCSALNPATTTTPFGIPDLGNGMGLAYGETPAMVLGKCWSVVDVEPKVVLLPSTTALDLNRGGQQNVAGQLW